MKPLAAIFTGLALILGFQNCSKTPLEPIVTVEMSSAKGKFGICLDSDLTVDSFYVANLNLVNDRGVVATDSDADGMADVFEAGRGYASSNRRTHGGILDSICWQIAGGVNCQSLIPTCSAVQNSFGLSECDIKALGLDSLFDHPVQGLDSDKDGIPDLLEIMRGTLPNTLDAVADSDHDGLLNHTEIARGSNPLFADVQFSTEWTVVATATKEVNLNCATEFWTISANHIPIGHVPGFADVDLNTPLALSHEKNENVVLTAIKLRPVPGAPGKPRMLVNLSKISSESSLELSGSDFSNAGEMEP